MFISDDVFLLKASREFIRDDMMSFIQGNNKDGRDILIRFPPLLSLKMIKSVIDLSGKIKMLINDGHRKANGEDLDECEQQKLEVFGETK